MKKYFNYLFSLERTGIKYDLGNISMLMRHLGEPHKNFKTIHIAGTNGKGATASFLASIFMEAGFKTALYTSPHLIKFNERISVNNRFISDKYIVNFLNENKYIIKKIKPSFFELTTAMAFKYFSDRKVQIAVIETGMGGRLDSTNIINSDVAVITKIALDHRQYLGNTLKKIAGEKIGIVKNNSLVVISDNNPSLRNFFISRIPSPRLFLLDDNAEIFSKGSSTYIRFINHDRMIKYHSVLAGKYQIYNASAAALAYILYMKKYGFNIENNNIENGIKHIKLNTSYRCRLEIIRHGNKTYILDISHNPDAIRTTLNELNFKPDVIVFAIMKDKDYKSAVKEISKHGCNLIFTGIKYPRSLSPHVLYKVITRLKYNHENFHISDNLAETKKIIEKMNYKTILFIGSFFLISEVISTFGLKKYLK